MRQHYRVSQASIHFDLLTGLGTMSRIALLHCTLMETLSGTSSVSDVPVKVIQPHRGWVGFDLRQLWHSRELLYFLSWREIKVRYKQTALGAAWALIQPLLTTLVF